MGRPLANCVTNGQGLNEAMLAAGWAEADPHDPALAAIEAKARAAGRGQWSGSPPAVR
jgi:endonuclease YncB( thermonuclease family)